MQVLLLIVIKILLSSPSYEHVWKVQEHVKSAYTKRCVDLFESSKNLATRIEKSEQIFIETGNSYKSSHHLDTNILFTPSSYSVATLTNLFRSREKLKKKKKVFCKLL